MRYSAILVALIMLLAGCTKKVEIVQVVPAENGPAAIKQSKMIVSDNHLEQGKHMYYKEKYPQATKHLVRAIANDAHNWDAYYYLGLVQQKQQQWDRSIGSFNNSLKFCPQASPFLGDIYIAIGFSWEKEGFLDKAGEKYNYALKINPEHAGARAGLERIKDKQTKAEKKKKMDKHAF